MAELNSFVDKPDEYFQPLPEPYFGPEDERAFNVMKWQAKLDAQELDRLHVGWRDQTFFNVYSSKPMIYITSFS